MIATFELTKNDHGQSAKIFFIKLIRVLADLDLKSSKDYADKVMNGMVNGETRVATLRINQLQHAKLKSELNGKDEYHGVRFVGVESEPLDYDELRASDYYVFRAPEFRDQMEKLRCAVKDIDDLINAVDGLGFHNMGKVTRDALTQIGHNILNCRDAINKSAIAPPSALTNKQTA
jgi:hypothetical protein